MLEVLSEHSLHAAAKAGIAERVRAFIAAGRDVNGKEGQHGMTPVHLAVLGGHDEVLKLLLAAGVDANTKNGVSPSIWAHMHTHGCMCSLSLCLCLCLSLSLRHERPCMHVRGVRSVCVCACDLIHLHLYLSTYVYIPPMCTFAHTSTHMHACTRACVRCVHMHGDAAARM